LLYHGLVLGDYRPASDADHYHDLARSLSEGDGFAHPVPFTDPDPQPTAFRPPLFPAVLAGAYVLFGAHVGVALAVNAALGVGVVVLAGMVGARLAGPGGGVAAGALVAVHPALVANDGPPVAEPLSLCLLLLTVLLLHDGRVVAAGVATGLQLLTKPSAQGLALVVAAWILWRWGWRRALAFGLPVLLVAVPWVVRNAVVIGSPVLVSSNGFNLAALYSPQAAAADGWLDPLGDPRFEDVRRGPSERQDELALDAAFRELAVDHLLAHPFELVERGGENVLRLFELTPAENDPAEVSDGRNLSFRYATLWATWVVIVAGGAGLYAARRRAAAQLLVLGALYLTAVSVVFSPMPPRLRAPLDLACCLGAAVALRRVTRPFDPEVKNLHDPAPPSVLPVRSESG
jgi:hypothetical protein